MKTNLIRLGGLAAILAGMALHKKSKIFVSDVELQKEFANSYRVHLGVLSLSEGWKPWAEIGKRLLAFDFLCKAGGILRGLSSVLPTPSGRIMTLYLVIDV